MKILNLLFISILFSTTSFGVEISHNSNFLLQNIKPDRRIIYPQPGYSPYVPGTLLYAIEHDDVDFFNAEFAKYERLPILGLKNGTTTITWAILNNSVKIIESIARQCNYDFHIPMIKFSEYRNRPYEIFKIFESKSKPSYCVLENTLKYGNKDLFCYLCLHYPEICNMNSIISEFSTKVSRLFSHLPSKLNKVLEQNPDRFEKELDNLKASYPVVFDNFSESDLDNQDKIVRAIKIYFGLANHYYIGKIDLPMFEDYSQKHYPNETIENAMLKIAGSIFNKSALPKEIVLDRIINILNDEYLVRDYYSQNKDNIPNEIGVLAFFDILQKLERDKWYKDCFEETIKYGSYMIDFWENVLEGMEKDELGFSIIDFVRNKLNEVGLSSVEND